MFNLLVLVKFVNKNSTIEEIILAKLYVSQEPDDVLILRVAWLYYMRGLTQEEVASRLSVHRTRIVRLLSEARERGLVTVNIHHTAIREIELEQAIADHYGLDFCIATPAFGFTELPADQSQAAAQSLFARRAVGSAAASYLTSCLSRPEPRVIGVSWGRTIEQMALHLGTVRNPQVRFVSLLGSLARNSASNPFEVVQALAARTGGEGYFLPVPFVVDKAIDRDVLMSQKSVQEVLALARRADLYLISVGELTESSILRQQGMVPATELEDALAHGAVADTLGCLFDKQGQILPHPVSTRMLAVDIADLKGRDVVLLAGGIEKLEAIHALLRSGLVRGVIIDGDTARLLQQLSK